MSKDSFQDSDIPFAKRTASRNWLLWILTGVMVGTRKTLTQRVIGGVVLLASFLWLTVNFVAWINLCLKQGMLVGLASLCRLFIWNVLPYIIVSTWVNSLIIRRRARGWVTNPESQAAEIQALLQKAKDLPQRRMQGQWIGFGIVVISLTAAIANGGIKDNSSPNTKSDKNVRQFSQSPTVTVKRNPNVDYLDITSEYFYVYKPKSYTGNKPFGLIVYMPPGDDCQLPAGWADVLEKRHFLFVAPQAVGNGTYESRRSGMGIMSALAMMQEYKIDPSRVYAAGLSGGARSASMMAFAQPDLFKGTIQDCGSDFYKSVAHNHTSNWTDSIGKPYGVIDEVLPADVIAARKNVRFVFITGPKDFRRGNLIDLYENGYKPDGFQCELLDVASMGHEDCTAETLNKALDFISVAMHG